MALAVLHFDNPHDFLNLLENLRPDILADS
jgi:hypothetical protein